MNKPVLMIHEVDEKMFDLPLENYVLTFDDGLYTQYLYRKEFQKFKTPKIYFISTNILAMGTQSAEFITCREAHQKAFAGDKSNYMNLEQVRDLMNDPYTTIGGHSHNHKRLDQLDSVVDKIYHMKMDTELMLAWFDSNLNYRPTQFCFPYNEDPYGLYKLILEKQGFTEFHGHERIPIETLLHDASQPASHDA